MSYTNLSQLRKDCEQLQDISEHLLEFKNKSETDAITIQKLSEDIQRFEEENRILSENNSLLHVFFQEVWYLFFRVILNQ